MNTKLIMFPSPYGVTVIKSSDPGTDDRTKT